MDQLPDVVALLFDSRHWGAHAIASAILGVLGIALMVVSNLMKRMVPLRLFAVVAEAMFIGYALVAREWVTIGLHSSLLLINLYRLWDLWRLLRNLEAAGADAAPREWLLPYMKKKRVKAGTVLFAKGDDAHEIIYVAKGTVAIREIGQTLGAGSLIGEIGLFTADRKRTATIVCQTACDLYSMTDEAIYLLYFQNPKLGFYLIRLIVQRLLKDLARRPEGATA